MGRDMSPPRSPPLREGERNILYKSLINQWDKINAIINVGCSQMRGREKYRRGIALLMLGFRVSELTTFCSHLPTCKSMWHSRVPQACNPTSDDERVQ